MDYDSDDYSVVFSNDLSFVKRMNVTKEILVKHSWHLKHGGAYTFNSDGTLLYQKYNGEKVEGEFKDLWRFSEDSSQNEIDPPVYNNVLGMTMVYCTVLSIVEESDGNYFLYRAVTSVDAKECRRCHIEKIEKK